MWERFLLKCILTCIETFCKMPVGGKHVLPVLEDTVYIVSCTKCMSQVSINCLERSLFFSTLSLWLFIVENIK